MTRNTWILFSAIVIAFFGLLIYLSTRDRVDVSQFDETKIIPASAATGEITEHVYGNKDSKVVLIEYGDYQCSGCGSAYQPIKTITEKYKDQIAFVFRNYPIVSIHPHARAAAASVEAAGLMGKYWEMHDILYERQATWTNISANERADVFASYAKEIGLDENKFSSLLEEKSDAINAKIDFDQSLGHKINVDQTPTFVLNGTKIDKDIKDGKLIPSDRDDSTPPIWSSVADFEKLILLPELKKAGIDPPSTTKK